MQYVHCRGCAGYGVHKKHCFKNPDYTRSAEYADTLCGMGEFVSGFGEYELANELWVMARRMSELAEREKESRERIKKGF